MNRPCDFCNNDNKPAKVYGYKSASLKRLVKVCICEDCKEKDKKYIVTVQKGKKMSNKEYIILGLTMAIGSVSYFCYTFLSALWHPWGQKMKINNG